MAKTSREGWIGLRGKFKDMSVSKRIMMLYLAQLLISLAISTAIYYQVVSQYRLDTAMDTANQVLHSVEVNFSSMLDMVNEYSIIICYSSEMQQALRNANRDYDYSNVLRSNQSMRQLIAGSTAISSIYLFDNYNNIATAYTDANRELMISRISEAPWYQEVYKKRGAYIIRANGGGIFRQGDDPSAQRNYISMIRLVRDNTNLKSLGVAVINISQLVVENTYEDLMKNYGMRIAVYDDQCNRIVNTLGDADFDLDALLGGEDGGRVERIRWAGGKQQCVLTTLVMPNIGWRLVGVLPVEAAGWSAYAATFTKIAVFIILLNGLLMALTWLAMTRMISKPIRALLRAMRGVGSGQFEHMELDTGKNEFGELKDGYNAMSDKIDRLFTKIVEEQQNARKFELDVLQAQIKPHFLYNAFDSISALAMEGRMKDVLAMVQALGRYYRTSLSKGSEVITVEQEIDIVRNYLTIQQYRYGDVFHVEYDVDPQVNAWPTLRLILQPIVENAIYHGIRPMGGGGVIQIIARDEPDFVTLIVSDNGVGMDGERLHAIIDLPPSMEKRASFGMRGTMERIHLFYGRRDLVAVNSEFDVGTTVTIRIPKNFVRPGAVEEGNR
jgi:two-component system sensor histidine kinase YesM